MSHPPLRYHVRVLTPRVVLVVRRLVRRSHKHCFRCNCCLCLSYGVAIDSSSTKDIQTTAMHLHGANACLQGAAPVLGLPQLEDYRCYAHELAMHMSRLASGTIAWVEMRTPPHGQCRKQCPFKTGHATSCDPKKCMNKSMMQLETQYKTLKPRSVAQNRFWATFR